MGKRLKTVSAVLLLAVASNMVTAQSLTTNTVLILHDSSGTYGWLGSMYAKMLANLLGHFDLPYQITPVESYQSGDMDAARTVFYLGTTYDNTLSNTFTQDLLSTTNTVCWMKYNLWQLAGAEFEAKFGFQFNYLDSTGYSNIVYKGETFLKNQLDQELGLVTVLNTNVASALTTACRSNDCIPYIIHGSNLWYVADIPFSYISEEDRYIIFTDLLHDILGIDHPESHHAIIRIEDVTIGIYVPAQVRQIADYLHSVSVPFGINLIPVYLDSLGYYNGGTPEEHRISDTGDSLSVALLASVNYAVSNGAQILMHGYTHQYDTTNNPYDGVTSDDFEFWREAFEDNTNTSNIVLYSPVPEDSASWVQGRLDAAFAELSGAGLDPVGWVTPHYAASALDYQVFATNFPLTMQRVIYFDDVGNVAGQFFPYVIHKDVYGQKIIPENLGNVVPEAWYDYPARLPADIVRAARKNLVVRDGWANSYFHGFCDITNLQAIIEGVTNLGYVYVPVSPSGPPLITFQPRSHTNAPGTIAKFGVAAIGTEPFDYQWRFNNSDLGYAVSPLLTITNVQVTDGGDYTVVVTNNLGSVTSAVATLTITTSPLIIFQPQSQTNVIGMDAGFSVAALGAPPLSYQWRFDGTDLLGQTNATLTVTNVQTNNAGAYLVVVANPYGVSTSAVALLTVVFTPAITTPPQSRTNIAGTDAGFSAVATGTEPLSYQWQFDGTDLLGQTNATLTVTNVQTNNAGAYLVVVANPYGVSTSAVALLTVVFTPAITTPPQSRTNIAGTDAGFSAVATGTEPLSYQWRFVGTDLLGQTNATLTVTNVQTNNAGAYLVVVANPYGVSTSAVATLTVTVNVSPSITTQPQSQNKTIGSTVIFDVTAVGTAPLRYQWRFNNAVIASATNATLTLTNLQTTRAGNYTAVITNTFGSVTSAVAALVVGSAPAITVQPTSRVVLSGAASTTFSVTATGTATLRYQWRFDGTNVANATNASFTLSNVQTNRAGGYAVVVTNAFGSVTSAVATLMVTVTPKITVQPQSRTNLAGTSATFTVEATGTAPLRYQWRFNNAVIASATNATFTISSVQSANAGGYSVSVANAVGSVVSAMATLKVNVPATITTQPQNRTNLAGTAATFSVTATGTATLRYQWRFDGTNVANATNASFTLSNVQTNRAGGYAVVVTNAFGSVTSAVATLMVTVTPKITVQPQSRTNLAGTSATFTVEATGTAPLRYQWRFNNAVIASATNATFTISSVQSANAGGYSVSVANAVGSVVSAMATLKVNVPATITTQPQNRTNLAGTAATFSVTATGTATLRYQWRFDGTNVANATNASFTLSNVQTNRAGGYAVVVTNAFGSVTSAAATLTIGTRPTITWQPQTQFVPRGTNVNLTVTATGSEPLRYQWRLNNVNIAGATNAILTLTNIQSANSGFYRVVVSNNYGSATSKMALLLVQ